MDNTTRQCICLRHIHNTVQIIPLNTINIFCLNTFILGRVTTQPPVADICWFDPNENDTFCHLHDVRCVIYTIYGTVNMCTIFFFIMSIECCVISTPSKMICTISAVLFALELQFQQQVL